jgi:hypothetical protein
MAPYQVSNVIASVALAQYAGEMSDLQPNITQFLSAVAMANNGPGLDYP